MKIRSFLGVLPFVFAALTQAGDVARNVVEIVVKNDTGTVDKANGLLFRNGDDTYVLTIGHEFRAAEDGRSLELVSFGGERARGKIAGNHYDEDQASKTDVAVVKVAEETPLACTYDWQRGTLIDDVAQTGAAVLVFNGIEPIEGYRIVSPPTDTSIFLKASSGARAKKGYSGSPVVINGVVIGLLRASDPNTDSLEVIRLNVATAFVERSMRSLAMGDAQLVLDWCARDLRTGGYPRAKTWLERARALAALASVDRRAIEHRLALGQASYDLAHGKAYEAEQSLQQLLTTLDDRVEWRYRAECLILRGRIGQTVGYKFAGKYADRMRNPLPSTEEALLGPIQEAQKHFDEAVKLLRQHQEPALLGAALLGQAAGLDYEAQQRSYREVVDLCRKVAPFEAVVAGGLLNRIRMKLGFPGETRMEAELATLSEHEKAMAYLSLGRAAAAVEILRSRGTPFEVAFAQELAGDASEDPDVALPLYRSALSFYTIQRFGTLWSYRIQAKAQRFYPRSLSEGNAVPSR